MSRFENGERRLEQHGYIHHQLQSNEESKRGPMRQMLPKLVQFDEWLN
jgi:hypothetical protein